MNRRSFVTRAGAVGGALAVSGVAAAQNEANQISMDVEVHPSWLTWVTAANACLRALGVECDNIDVAGHSGYAFHMCITDVVGVEGPTVLPWSDLDSRIRLAGRSTLSYAASPWASDEEYREADRHAFELAKREVDAGRPCVLWGIQPPEFGTVIGYDGDYYIHKWSGAPNTPLKLKYDETTNPGGAYLLTFPTASTTPLVTADMMALRNALDFLNRPSYDASLSFGLAAYDPWIAALNAKRAHGFGNNYCAQCFSNGRQYARDFITRLAERNEHAAGPLDRTVIAYEECADAMGIVAQLFPFPGPEEENIEDPITIDDACRALAIARDAEIVAADAIREALEVEWPGA
ncbi:MAG TPA: twin-arginine translocation signal domain-containing protein [Armatimonadota bacterium]|nr:twin-arginine translocation signal domain-containing protein [Armatimonadota bacterium]